MPLETLNAFLKFVVIVGIASTVVGGIASAIRGDSDDEPLGSYEEVYGNVR